MYKEDTVKYKVLATLVAGSLLAACNSSNSSDSYKLQAYDPAIQNMAVSYKCNDATEYTSAGKTNYDGNANIDNAVVTATPERCAFKFVGGSDAIDTSNSKSMDGVTYLIPKGLAQAGQLVTASPLTTLIANQLGENEYDESTADTILRDLGLGDLLNNGTSISDLLLKTETVANGLTSAEKATLLATTVSLNNILKSDSSSSVNAIAAAAKKYAAVIVVENPNFPTNKNGKPADTDFDLTASAIAALTSAQLTLSVKDSVKDGAVVIKDTVTPTGTGTGTGSSSGGS